MNLAIRIPAPRLLIVYGPSLFTQKVYCAGCRGARGQGLRFGKCHISPPPSIRLSCRIGACRRMSGCRLQQKTAHRIGWAVACLQLSNGLQLFPAGCSPPASVLFRIHLHHQRHLPLVAHHGQLHCLAVIGIQRALPIGNCRHGIIAHLQNHIGGFEPGRRGLALA